MEAGSGLAAALPAAAASEPNTDAIIGQVSAAWFKLEWNRYAARFIAPDGRVVDNANQGISHSEGQGYGLLLAALAGDAGRFEALWRWTAQKLMVRKDGLAAWKWDPRTGAIADLNNATDGDILIAWALSEGAGRFGRADYRAAAERIARAVGALAVRSGKQGLLLMPGSRGFDAGEQPDGPVVNLSYWVFPAFPALKVLAPDTDWDGLGRNGMALLEASRFGPYGLPTEWESVAGDTPQPARNFRAEFGYNAVRIPLYLALEGGPASRRALRRFAGAWTQTMARPLDVKVAAVTPPLAAPGYDLVFALARCVVAGQVIPADVIKARSDLYYPETLRLLSIIAIQERAPQCL
jgi:endo-1,4-beta-D-glucanase Y